MPPAASVSVDIPEEQAPLLPGSRRAERSLSPSSAASFLAEDDYNLKRGLTADQVKVLRARHGENRVPAPETPLWWLVAKQFSGAMPVMIELAGVLAGVVRSW